MCVLLVAHVSKVSKLQASARYVYAVCGEKKFQLVDGSRWQAKRGEKEGETELMPI